MPASPALDKLSPLARPLYNGMKGADVLTLKTIVEKEGFCTRKIENNVCVGELTDVMDEATFRAVRELQLEKQIVKSEKTPGFGHVGPATRAFVNKLLKEEPKPTPKKEEPAKKEAQVKPPVKKEAASASKKEAPKPTAKPEPKKEAASAPAPKTEPVTPASGGSVLDKVRKLLKQ
jgi:hypothetical protein